MKVFDYSSYLKYGNVTIDINLSGIDVDKQVDIIGNLTSLLNYITNDAPTSVVDEYRMYCDIYDEADLPENKEDSKDDEAE